MLSKCVLLIVLSIVQHEDAFAQPEVDRCDKFDFGDKQNACTCKGSTIVSCEAFLDDSNTAQLQMINQKFARLDDNFIFTDFSPTAEKVQLSLLKLPLEQLTTNLFETNVGPREPLIMAFYYLPQISRLQSFLENLPKKVLMMLVIHHSFIAKKGEQLKMSSLNKFKALKASWLHNCTNLEVSFDMSSLDIGKFRVLKISNTPVRYKNLQILLGSGNSEVWIPVAVDNSGNQDIPQFLPKDKLKSEMDLRILGQGNVEIVSQIKLKLTKSSSQKNWG